MTLLTLTDAGFYCSAGDFYIDPWQPVSRAVITHAHSDHARVGSNQYLAAAEGLGVLRSRLGSDAMITGVPYGEAISLHGVEVSLHPAGHMLGSSQIRIEHQGHVCVLTGDFKWADDVTCQKMEPLRCHLLVTESTFGLPIYRWPTSEHVVAEIHEWWRSNQQHGKASILYVYAIGKAQRVLAMLDQSIGPVWAHGAVVRGCLAYQESGLPLPPIKPVYDAPPKTDWSQALVLAPPSAHNSPWLRRFGSISTAAASGWMRIRGIRRRRAIDRGFELSDHADWAGLLQMVEVSEAEEVWATHGYTTSLVRFLRERGHQATAVATQFRGESLDAVERDDAETDHAAESST